MFESQFNKIPESSIPTRESFGRIRQVANMEIDVAVRLIKDGVDQNSTSQVWADLGSGKGLFTAALSSLLAPESVIHAIDKDASALSKIQVHRNDISLYRVEGDFVSNAMELNDLDGVIMANSLHFVKDKLSFVTKLKKKLKQSGKLVLIEYDMDNANHWVPYPISFSSLTALAAEVGFVRTMKIGEEPSAFNRANLYAAVLRRTAAS